MENITYQINEDHVLFSELDEDGVLFDIKKNEYLTLNATFTSIFKYLQNGLGTQEVLEKLLEEYEVTEETCLNQLHGVIDRLVELEFMSRSS